MRSSPMVRSFVLMMKYPLKYLIIGAGQDCQVLRKSNLSENTITSYLWTVNFFHSHYDEVNKENLLAYKGYLMEFFKPKTVNLRIQGINKYLEFLGKEKLQLKAVKVQQKNFLENVISNADYNYLKKQLKKDGNMEWYFVVWYLAATGARVSELIQIKIEHIENQNNRFQYAQFLFESIH